MLDAHVGLAADEDVRVAVLEVGEEVEREDDGAVGRVLDGHDAIVGGAGLDGREDVFDVDDRLEGVDGLVESVEGCLGRVS